MMAIAISTQEIGAGPGKGTGEEHRTGRQYRVYCACGQGDGVASRRPAQSGRC